MSASACLRRLNICLRLVGTLTAINLLRVHGAGTQRNGSCVGAPGWPAALAHSATGRLVLAVRERCTTIRVVYHALLERGNTLLQISTLLLLAMRLHCMSALLPAITSATFACRFFQAQRKRVGMPMRILVGPEEWTCPYDSDGHNIRWQDRRA